jgi:hypothetical protein
MDEIVERCLLREANMLRNNVTHTVNEYRHFLVNQLLSFELLLCMVYASTRLYG